MTLSDTRPGIWEALQMNKSLIKPIFMLKNHPLKQPGYSA